jgi:hypothetical protein
MRGVRSATSRMRTAAASISDSATSVVVVTVWN